MRRPGPVLRQDRETASFGWVVRGVGPQLKVRRKRRGGRVTAAQSLVGEELTWKRSERLSDTA